MTPHPPDVYRYFQLRKFLWRVRREGTQRSIRMAWRRAQRPTWLMGSLIWLMSCTLSAGTPPTQTPLPSATPTAPSNDAWQSLAPGLERRIYNPPSGFFTRLTVLRIDPGSYDFRVRYRPGEPLMAEEWAATYPEAAAIFNTNFFDRNDEATGMLFEDGVRYGDAYRRRGGTFFIRDGVPGIQSNLVQPYSGEVYDQAAQAFPMLMTDGSQSYFDTRPDRASRRTVVAIDQQGRVLVLVTSFGGITLLDLATYLPTTDMNIVDALNLDGGGSTLLAVNTSETSLIIESFDPVPAVFAVYPR